MVAREEVDVTASPDTSAEWWTTSDVAAYLGVRLGTVTSYRRRGHLPDPDRQFGRTPLWRPGRIIAWHESRPRPRPGGQPAPAVRTRGLERALRDAIRGDRYQVGSKLPSERELAAQNGVGRTTVRVVLARLASEGLVEARQGRGYFVAVGPSSDEEPAAQSVGGTVVEVAEASSDSSHDLQSPGRIDPL